MTDAIERIGAALAFGSMLFNLAWATGETIGAPAAASLSRATSDAVPLAALAALMLATLVAVRLGLRDQFEVDAVLVTSSNCSPSVSSRISATLTPGSAQDAQRVCR